MTDAERLWKALKDGDKATAQGLKSQSAGEDRPQEPTPEARAGGQGAVALAFAVIGHYEWKRNRIAWTLCLGRWRWPVWVTQSYRPGVYGWVRGIGWIWS